MNKISILFIFIIALSNVALFICSANPNIKILGVVEITRHGAKAPLVRFTHNKNLYFGTKRSQLTINGFRQHILLGRWIRRRYVEGDVYKLFEKDMNKFNPKEIKVITSPLQRTIFSACAHILGLFPKAIIKPYFEGHPEVKTNDTPPIEKYHSDNRDGKEITVNVINDNFDNLFRAYLCKRIGLGVFVNKEMQKEEIFKIGDRELKTSIKNIVENYGVYFKTQNYKIEKKKYTTKTLLSMIKFLFPVQYHKDNDSLLKKDTLKTIKKRMLNRFYGKRLNDSDGKKLYCSRMFDMILDFFNDKIEGKGIEKMLIFSGHDFNLMNILSNLMDSTFLKEKIFSSIDNMDDYLFLLPPLASSFLIELIEVNGYNTKFVRIIYNGVEIFKNFAKKVDLNCDLKLLEYNGFRNLLLSRIDFSYKTLNCMKSKLK